MLSQQLEQQAKAVDTIIGNMRVLENKLAEAKMKKDTLKARAQSAKSAAAINDMVRRAPSGTRRRRARAGGLCQGGARRPSAAVLGGAARRLRCSGSPATAPCPATHVLTRCRAAPLSRSPRADCGAGHQQRAGRL